MTFSRLLFFILSAALLSPASGIAFGKETQSGITRSLKGEFPQPPGQPVSGPGGTAYFHKDMRENVFSPGTGIEYRILYPALPKAEKASVVIFLHGWSAVDPSYYGGWLRHLVLRGHIVIWLRYQEDLRTPPGRFTPNAASALRDAFSRLNQAGGPYPLPAMQNIAAAGHSMGGLIAMNLAAGYADYGLPPIRAVFCLQPAAGGYDDMMGDYSQIPSGTLLLIAGSEDDEAANINLSRDLMEKASSAADVNHILIKSDARGVPALTAGHQLAIGNERGGLDALDWYGVWKWFDGLTDLAFHQKNGEFALGDTEAQRHMGFWSDGVPVKEPVVTLRRR